MSIKTGSEFIVEYLIRQGVKYIFGIPGHGCLGFTDALFKHKDEITLVQMKQEMTGVHMAVGYYRVTGQPLAVFTSIGPGAINTAIGLGDAYVDSMPVLVITGDTHVHMRGKGVLQEIERDRDSSMPKVVDALVKRSWHVAQAGQLPAILRRSFNYMMSGRRGPVHIDLPMDVQCEAIHTKVTESGIFMPSKPSHGNPELIKQAAELFANAQRPVILVGGGVIASGAYEELQTIAELTGAAVIVTMMGKDALPNDHDLFAWSGGSKGTTCGNYLASHADVLLALGTRFADETSSSYKDGVTFSIPPTQLIQIDIDPNEIGKNYPSAIGIAGDVKAVLQDINQEIQANGWGKDDYHDTSYFKEIQELKTQWSEFLAQHRDDTLEPVMISTVLQEVRAIIAQDAIVVTSSGNVQSQMLQEFPFYEPHTCITAGGFSTMGYTLPASIGAKLGAPNRQVVGLVGDGEFLMSIQELSTAVQLNLPILIVVLNNCGWMAITDLQRAAYGEDRAYGTEFTDHEGNPYTPHFADIASAFGCYAERISGAGEIRPAIERALASGKPAVVEIMVTREWPYTGSPAVGWWDVPVPVYLKDRRKKYEEERTGENLS